jgi:hypothetical protein
MAVVGVFAVSTGTMAERPPGAGGGGGGGSKAPPDYGDLYVLYRYPSGIPVLTADSCVQPLAAEPFDGCIQKPGTTDPADCLIIPVDPATCAVPLDYAIYTQEADFGRINEARSPDAVFDTQLEEVMVNIATAGCLTLDPAGRPVYSSLDTDGEVPVVLTSTVDSPLQNLAIYRQLMLEGSLPGGVVLPGMEEPNGWMSTAAHALGAASDKAGKVTIDVWAYLNDILGLTDMTGPAALERECIMVKEEVMGKIVMVEKCFLLVGDFAYTRSADYTSLPRPPYIPAELPQEGYFEYLKQTGVNIFQIVDGPILNAVFADGAGGYVEYSESGAEAFAQMADDARAVIDFMHIWAVPGGLETTVPCEVGADTFYDVFISDMSGLQVPVRMVAGTEGREGVVTVSNDGPADATGTVMVTGVDLDGLPIGPLYAVVDGVVTEDPIFVTPEEFTLPAGYSKSWTFFFSMDYATKITWTAVADAEFDVNLENNTVMEETVVNRAKGGSGGH